MLQHLKDEDTTFLQLGTCSLHPVHTAFSKGVKALFKCEVTISEEEKKKVNFDLDDFFQDLHFFF